MTNNISELKSTVAARAALTTALSGKSPRQRGEEKMHAALDWVYRWGWSTPSIIDFVGGNAANGLAARLVKRGLLTKTRTASGGSVKGVPIWLLHLSPAGLVEVERVRNELLPYQLDPYRTRQDQLRHYTIAQTATAKSLKTGYVVAFQTETELAQRSSKDTKQPDIVWYLPDGIRMAIEVELTAKWGRDLDHFVLACLIALHPRAPEGSKFDQLALVSDSPAIISRYSKALTPGAHFRTWTKDEQRRWITEQEKIVPEWVQGKILCKLID